MLLPKFLYKVHGLRVIAAFLALSLTLSTPAFALRDQEPMEKKPEILSGLEEALRGDPNRLVQFASTALGLSSSSATPATSPPAAVSPRSAVGLEEAEGQIFHGFRGPVQRVAFTRDPEQNLLAAAAGNTVVVFDWKSEGGRRSIKLGEPALAATFSSTQHGILIVTPDRTIRPNVHYPKYGQTELSFTFQLPAAERLYPHSLAFSPDRKRLLVMGRELNEARVQNLAPEDRRNYKGTHGILATLRPKQGRPISGAFHPDGKVVALGTNLGTVELWRLPRLDKGETEAKFLVEREEPGGAVLVPFFSPDGKLLVTGNASGTIRLWEWDGEKEILTLRHSFSLETHQPIYSISFLPVRVRNGPAQNGGSRDKNLSSRVVAAAGEDGIIRFWDTVSGEELARMGVKKPSPIFSVSFSPNGEKIAAGRGGTLALWKVPAKVAQWVASLPPSPAPDTEKRYSDGGMSPIRLMRGDHEVERGIASWTPEGAAVRKFRVVTEEIEKSKESFAKGMVDLRLYEEKKPVGYVRYGYFMTTGTLNGLYIEPEYRRQGLSTVLLMVFFRALQEGGILPVSGSGESVDAYARQPLSALALKRFGFQGGPLQGAERLLFEVGIGRPARSGDPIPVYAQEESQRAQMRTMITSNPDWQGLQVVNQLPAEAESVLVYAFYYHPRDEAHRALFRRRVEDPRLQLVWQPPTSADAGMEEESLSDWLDQIMLKYKDAPEVLRQIQKIRELLGGLTVQNQTDVSNHPTVVRVRSQITVGGTRILPVIVESYLARLVGPWDKIVAESVSSRYIPGTKIQVIGDVGVPERSLALLDRAFTLLQQLNPEFYAVALSHIQQIRISLPTDAGFQESWGTSGQPIIHAEELKPDKPPSWKLIETLGEIAEINRFGDEQATSLSPRYFEFLLDMSVYITVVELWVRMVKLPEYQTDREDFRAPIYDRLQAARNAEQSLALLGRQEVFPYTMRETLSDLSRRLEHLEEEARRIFPAAGLEEEKREIPTGGGTVHSAVVPAGSAVSSDRLDSFNRLLTLDSGHRIYAIPFLLHNAVVFSNIHLAFASGGTVGETQPNRISEERAKTILHIVQKSSDTALILGGLTNQGLFHKAALTLFQRLTPAQIADWELLYQRTGNILLVVGWDRKKEMAATTLRTKRVFRHELGERAILPFHGILEEGYFAIQKDPQLKEMAGRLLSEEAYQAKPIEFWAHLIEPNLRPSRAQTRAFVTILRRTKDTKILQAVRVYDGTVRAISKELPLLWPQVREELRKRVEGEWQDLPAGMEEGKHQSTNPVVIIGPSAMALPGVRQAVELLREAGLEERLIILPDAGLPPDKLNQRLVDLATRSFHVPNPVFIGYASSSDPVMERFQMIVQRANVPFEHRPLTSLRWIVSQILDDLGNPKGMPPELFFQWFVSLSGVEEAA